MEVTYAGRSRRGVPTRPSMSTAGRAASGAAFRNSSGVISSNVSRAAQRVADDAHLFGLGRRLGAGQDVVAADGSVLAQDPRDDLGHVAVVDGAVSARRTATDHAVAPDRGDPPAQGVRREHPWPDDRRVEPGRPR